MNSQFSAPREQSRSTTPSSSVFSGSASHSASSESSTNSPYSIPAEKRKHAAALLHKYKRISKESPTDSPLQEETTQHASPSQNSYSQQHLSQTRLERSSDTQALLGMMSTLKFNNNPTIYTRPTAGREKPLSKKTKAKAALLRYLGSCATCRRRKVTCSLNHYDLASLKYVERTEVSNCDVSVYTEDTLPKLSHTQSISPGDPRTFLETDLLDDKNFFNWGNQASQDQHMQDFGYQNTAFAYSPMLPQPLGSHLSIPDQDLPAEEYFNMERIPNMIHIGTRDESGEKSKYTCSSDGCVDSFGDLFRLQNHYSRYHMSFRIIPEPERLICCRCGKFLGCREDTCPYCNHNFLLIRVYGSDTSSFSNEKHPTEFGYQDTTCGATMIHDLTYVPIRHGSDSSQIAEENAMYTDFWGNLCQIPASRDTNISHPNYQQTISDCKVQEEANLADIEKGSQMQQIITPEYEKAAISSSPSCFNSVSSTQVQPQLEAKADEVDAQNQQLSKWKGELSPQLGWLLESLSESDPTSEADSEFDSESEIDETGHVDFICLRNILQEELQEFQNNEAKQVLSLLKDLRSILQDKVQELKDGEAMQNKSFLEDLLSILQDKLQEFQDSEANQDISLLKDLLSILQDKLQELQDGEAMQDASFLKDLRNIVLDELQKLQDGEAKQNITLLKEQLISHVLKEFWTCIPFNKSSNSIICAGTSPSRKGSFSHNPDPVEHLALSCTQGVKRKRQDDNRKGKDESLANRANKVGSKGKSKNDNTQPFACPFRKHNATKYGISCWPFCSLSSYSSISRLKEHLIRGPHRIWECDRCQTGFDSEHKRKDHNREAIQCQLSTGIYVEGEGIHPHHVDWLRARGSSYTAAAGKSYFQQSEEERWFTIFQKLFSYPDDMVPSPYFEEPIDGRTTPFNSADIDGFQRYFREELVRDFRRHAASEFSEDAINRVSAIFEDCMPRILMRFNQERTNRSTVSQASNNNVEPDSQLRESSASSNSSSRLSQAMSARRNLSAETDPTEYSPPQTSMMQLSDRPLEQQSEAGVQDGLDSSWNSEYLYNSLGTGFDENFGFEIDGGFDFSITGFGNDINLGALGCGPEQSDGSGQSQYS